MFVWESYFCTTRSASTNVYMQSVKIFIVVFLTMNWNFAPFNLKQLFVFPNQRSQWCISSSAPLWRQCTFHDGCKQGIDQQIFNRKSISRKITHPQSLFHRFYLNKDWGCVILREIDFLLKICWSIPCLHPSWKVHIWIEICASLNHRKKTEADGSRLIPRKHTETLVLLSIVTTLTAWKLYHKKSKTVR